jgi:protein SCO1/2
MPYRRITIVAALAFLLGVFLCPAHARADWMDGKPPTGPNGPAVPMGTTPPELRHVGVTEHLDTLVPLGAEFRDHTGKAVKLGDFFDGKRPVLLGFAYHRCPVLCSMILRATIDGLKQIGWTVGKEFDAVTISIDPKEELERTAHKRDQVIEAYGRPEAQQGWHFLVGDKKNIDAAVNAIGFEYQYDADQDQYAHPSVIMLLTPDGKIARYLYGLQFEPSDLRIGLLEASQGRSISTVEKVILFCYHYDPKSGKYQIMATRLMQLGGAVTLLVLGSALAVFWRRERKRAKQEKASEDATGEGGDPAHAVR